MTARVLYVDDEEDIREVASLALELDPELQVLTCASGEEAIRVASEWRPDLILLDVMMPSLDGPTTLARLREQAATAATPIVFITARAQPPETRRLEALGAAGVIAKPFDPMRLAATVRLFLAK